MPQLPPGFVIEDGSKAPQLPTGFVLEKEGATRGDPSRWSASNEAIEALTFGGMSKATAGAFGLADSVKDAIQGKGFNLSDNYNRILEQQRADQESYNEEHPYRTMAGQAAGLLTGVGTLPAAKVMQGAGMLPKVVNSAVTGTGYGALGGALQDADTLQDRAENTARTALFGGAIGATAPVLAKGVGKMLGGRAAPAPTADALKQQATQAYQRADNAGLVLKPDEFANMADDIASTVSQSGFHPKIHPKVAAALNEFEKGKAMRPSLGNIELLRRTMGSAAKSIEPDERRIASIAIERLDDLMENIQPNQVASGRANDAIDALKEARALWAKTRKTETIQTMMERAKNRASQFSGSGFENAMRTEFRQLAQSPKRMRSFSNEEQEAILKVVRGGKIENALRMVGKYAPTNPLYAAGGALLGHTAGGPLGAVGALAVPAVGAAARVGATKMTASNIDAVDDLIRRGYKPGQTPRSLGIEEAIKRLLQAQGGRAADALLRR